MVDGVGDQQHRAVGVVEHGQVGGEQHGELGEPEVVRGEVRQLLQAADDVVAEVAHQAAGERREAVVGLARGVQRRQGGPQHLQRVAVHRDADRRSALPAGVALGVGGESGRAAHADEGVPGPGALLGRLQQEGSRTLVGQAPVQADGGEAVREEPAGDRDDPGVYGELAESLKVHGVQHRSGLADSLGDSAEITERPAGRLRRSRSGRPCGRPRRPGRPGRAGCRRRSPARRP